MNAFLSKRQSDFAKMIGQTELQSEFPLTAEFSISPQLLDQLKMDVCQYLRASCQGLDFPVQQSGMQSYLEEFGKQAKNISTSGMVIPKKYCEQEFTQVHKTLAQIVEASGISKFIDYWVFPFNIRLKSQNQGSSDLGYPTEHPHTETWVGCSSRSALFHIPLMGDLDNNSLQIWRPTQQDYGLDCLRPLSSYQEGAELVKKSEEIKVDTHHSALFVVDSSLLHNTYRKENAGLRVSIDFNGILSGYSKEEYSDEKCLIVERQKLSHVDLMRIGNDRAISSPDGEMDRFSPPDGMRHPAHVRLVKMST